MSRNPTRSSIPISEGDADPIEVEVIDEATMQEGEMSGSGTEKSTPMDVDSTEASANSKQSKSSFSSSEDEKNDSSSSLNINSDERLKLVKVIDQLKLEVFHATMKGITGQEGSIEAKTLSAATRKLEIAQKSFTLLFPQENTMVPAETPCFQWKGHVFNRRKPIFLNIEDCLHHFERVLEAHRLSVNDNWQRLVPARLSTGMARWYATRMESKEFTSWSDFKIAIVSKYGRNQADIKEEAREKLEKIIYKKIDSFEGFMEEFQELKVAADIKDEDCLIRYLFKALPEELVKATKFYLNLNTDKQEVNIDFIIPKVVGTYEALFKEKWDKEISRSYLNHRSNNSYGNNSHRHSTQKKFFDKKKHSNFSDNLSTKGKPQIKCKYHPGLTNHSEEDCILAPDVKKRIDKAQKRYGTSVKICNRCKVPNYKYGHECKAEDLEKVFKNKQQKAIVPVEVEVNDDEMDTDDESESKMHFAALSIEDKKDCKLENNDFSQPPKHLMNNNSLILPITLESKKCIVKTYFLLDTGASFSSISPALAVKLEVEVNNKNNFGIIKTCQKDNVVKRMGCTDEKIKLTYNSRVCNVNLEVFDIFNGLHVIIGMDLITQFGITISNLAMDWDDDNNYEIPCIDPNPYIPNNQPFGTESERNRLFAEVNPLLEANKQIDPKAHCTLPGSTLRLHVRKDHEHKMYRAQWPLEEKVKPVVKAQINKWLENGVIERAPPGNPYNSPLFPVRKKNAQGEYSGDSRIVMDCRLVNAALDPAKSDRFPLPLISELHRKMSKHSIYTVIDLSQCFHSFAIHFSSRKFLSFTDPTTGLQYQYAKAPMGLTPLSSFVQRQLTNLFSDMNAVTTNFIDDITVHTEADMETHIKYVKIVIERLTKANLTINAAKTHLAQKSINILGFCLSEKGLALDQRKVSNILDWNPIVANSRELASRLGLINFFRAHLPCLSTLTAPLDSIKNAPDISQVWTDEHTIAMKKIQQLLVNAPVLSAPDMGHDMYLVTDSSAYGIGACLYQVKKKRVYYLGFIARKLTSCEMRWGSTKRELLAVVYAFKKYRQWLWGKKFHLFVDNKGLLYLHSQEKLTRMIENFYETIFELDFDITFCAGIHNILADRLSRIFEHGTKKLEGSDGMARRATIVQKRSNDNSSLDGSSNKKVKLATETLLEEKEDIVDVNREVIDKNKTDITTRETAITTDETVSTVKDANNLEAKKSSDTDLFIYASHLDIYEQPKDESEKKTLLGKAHLLGHFGVTAMEQVIHEEYQMHWKGLRKDIEYYVKNCSKCRVFNLGKHVYHPPKNIIPNAVFDHIVMDLGTFDVTTPIGNNYMMVVMDLFSRFIILRAIPDKLATTIAKELVAIWSLFGYSKVITHDNGKEFSNKLLEAIALHAGVEQAVSLPFNPLGNSNAESAVKSAKGIIIKMLEGRAENWDLYLDGTAYCLNLHKSRLHGMMPFVVVFARLPNELTDYSKIKAVLPEQEIDVKALKDKIKLVDKILVPAIREQIVKTKEADNAYFRKRHKILENPFPIGSSVMIKNVEKNKKTDPNYEGPYSVYGYTKNGSYILQDKAEAFLSRDIPTSHIKLISEDGIRPEENNHIFEIQAILNHRGEEPNHEYLVRWKGYDSSYDSWEPPAMFDSKEVIETYWSRRKAGQSSSKNKGKKNAKPKSVNKRKIESRQEKSIRRKARLAAATRK